MLPSIRNSELGEMNVRSYQDYCEIAMILAMTLVNDECLRLMLEEFVLIGFDDLPEVPTVGLFMSWHNQYAFNVKQHDLNQVFEKYLSLKFESCKSLLRDVLSEPQVEWNS